MSRQNPNPYAEGTYQHALFMALQIWDEYMKQIGRCVSQDYARLNEFPLACRRLGIKEPWSSSDTGSTEG